MHSVVSESHKIERALLCLGEADVGAALRKPIFGRPLIFHLIKSLQASGIARIALSVETIPPELPALVEQLRLEKLDIQLLRNGPEALRFVAEKGAILLQNAAVWIARAKLEKLIASDKPLILTLPEDPDFTEFERIDLGRRWAGIAVVDGSLGRELGNFPEGWRIDSFLLRAALQAGYPDRQLAWEKPADDVVIHAGAAGGLEILRKRIGPATKDRGLIENSAIHLIDHLIDRFAGEKWWQIVAEWSLLVFAILAAISAFFEYALTSYWLGVTAVFSGLVRARMREVTYRQGFADAVVIAAFATMILALHFNLRWFVSTFDATFLPIVLFGSATVIKSESRAIGGSQLSPLTIALWLAIMSSAGFSVLAVKLAILAVLALLFAGTLRLQS
ncbi:MAG: hypothetical protein ACRCY3_13260 [Sphingorhabdus sp.]